MDMEGVLSIHKLTYLGKVGFGIYTHDRDPFDVGQEVLFLGSKNIIGLGNMLGGGNQNKIGIYIFAEGKQFLLKFGRTPFLRRMDFIFNVILDQEAYGKIQVGVDLFLKVLIHHGRLVEMDL
jgi:hypothetical protein